MGANKVKAARGSSSNEAPVCLEHRNHDETEDLKALHRSTHAHHEHDDD